MTNTTERRIPLNVVLFFAAAIAMAVGVVWAAIDSSYGVRQSDVASYSKLTYTEVTFERQFGSGFWAEGPHEYTLAIDCPGSENDLRATQSFQVSTDAPRHSDRVLLRTTGLRTQGARAGTLTEFHPDDVSAAWAIVQLGRQEDAEACRVSVAWDGGQPQALNLIDSMNVAPDEYDW